MELQLGEASDALFHGVVGGRECEGKPHDAGQVGSPVRETTSKAWFATGQRRECC